MNEYENPWKNRMTHCQKIGVVMLLLPVISCSLLEPTDTPITRFQDTLSQGAPAPTMVVVPAGEFHMGSPEDEFGRDANEGPRHKVVFTKPFALGETEITVGQFARFIRATGYQTSAERDAGSFLRDPVTGNWGKHPVNWRHDHQGQLAPENYPVVHVSWDDAQAYAAWLTRETGLPYRLPSEAELEYANRAGRSAQNWWGDGLPVVRVGNLKGEYDQPANDLSFFPTARERASIDPQGNLPHFFPGYDDGYWGPAPVASFTANAFGLYDTTGNVWEWAQDCWHADYHGAPTDGSPWIDSGICVYRIVRGASWYCHPSQVRAANRWSRWPVFRNMYIGFRIARSLAL